MSKLSGLVLHDVGQVDHTIPVRHPSGADFVAHSQYIDVECMGALQEEQANR